MRLGDLDLAEKAIEENLNIAPCDRFAAMDEVRDTPTIDPEALPIVQQLRAEVQELTKNSNFWMDEYKKANMQLVKVCKLCEDWAKQQGAVTACDQCPIFEGGKHDHDASC